MVYQFSSSHVYKIVRLNERLLIIKIWLPSLWHQYCTHGIRYDNAYRFLLSCQEYFEQILPHLAFGEGWNNRCFGLLIGVLTFLFDRRPQLPSYISTRLSYNYPFSIINGTMFIFKNSRKFNICIIWNSRHFWNAGRIQLHQVVHWLFRKNRYLFNNCTTSIELFYRLGLWLEGHSEGYH